MSNIPAPDPIADPIAQSAAFSVGIAQVQFAHATALAMLNEVSAQQQARSIEQASVVAGLKGLLSPRSAKAVSND